VRLRMWLLFLIVPAGVFACALGAAKVAPGVLLILALGYPAIGFILGALFNPSKRKDSAVPPDNSSI